MLTDITYSNLSWFEPSNGHAMFPMQNLPFGVFSPAGQRPRVGVAVGNYILDLAMLAETGGLDGGIAGLVDAFRSSSLNSLMVLGPTVRRQLRNQLLSLFGTQCDGPSRRMVLGALHSMADCQMHLPTQIGDYTDFFAGIYHAQNAGAMMRPDDPLLPNYKYVPIGYHGRSSTVVVSGTPVKRPFGQVITEKGAPPVRIATRKMDFELELAVWVGQGNAQGESMTVAQAADACWGFGLLNDWSARDIQSWEYKPLGPFQAKNFATTVSPWVVTPEALAPYRTGAFVRPDSDPRPLDYLHDEHDQAYGGLDIEFEVALTTNETRARDLPEVIVARSNSQHLYWTVAQLLTHHASSGCALRPGDLVGTGTISGPYMDEAGSLLELTQDGRMPFRLASGEQRNYLQDGDEIILRGFCRKAGYPQIGLGECRGRIV